MKLSILSTIAAFIVSVRAGCELSGGNYYCSEVDAVVYSGIGYEGTYSDVTAMDESSCSCSQSDKSFSGTMSPLDEELSVHFRGPLKLLQFGVYYPSSGSKLKRDAGADVEECTTTKHVHHNHKRAVKIVEVTDTVIVDQFGNLITATATATSVSTTANDDGQTTTASLTTAFVSTYSSVETTSSSSSSAAASSSGSGSSSSSGDWTRVAYFQPGSKTNITFLNSLGGVNGSGTWSSCFGNSLSYCAADGSSASSESVALDEVTIESDTEYMIFSGSSCDDSSTEGDCGYYRDNIPLYHGFGGAEKIFVFEFQMPTESSLSSSTTNYDMPLIWLLNAKIPRTLQYGDSSCSCWSTGCGELDLFEILTSGEDRLISHLHSGQGDDGTSSGGGGSQDYFARPTDSSVKAALVFENGEVHVVFLDDSTDFGSSLSSDDVSSWESKTGGTAAISS